MERSITYYPSEKMGDFRNQLIRIYRDWAANHQRIANNLGGDWVVFSEEIVPEVKRKEEFASNEKDKLIFKEMLERLQFSYPPMEYLDLNPGTKATEDLAFEWLRRDYDTIKGVLSWEEFRDEEKPRVRVMEEASRGNMDNQWVAAMQRIQELLDNPAPPPPAPVENSSGFTWMVMAIGAISLLLFLIINKKK